MKRLILIFTFLCLTITAADYMANRRQAFKPVSGAGGGTGMPVVPIWYTAESINGAHTFGSPPLIGTWTNSGILAATLVTNGATGPRYISSGGPQDKPYASFIAANSACLTNFLGGLSLSSLRLYLVMSHTNVSQYVGCLSLAVYGQTDYAGAHAFAIIDNNSSTAGVTLYNASSAASAPNATWALFEWHWTNGVCRSVTNGVICESDNYSMGTRNPTCMVMGSKR